MTQSNNDPLTDLTSFVIAEKQAGRLTAQQGTQMAIHILRAAYSLSGWKMTAMGFRDVLALLMKDPLDEAAIQTALAAVNAGLDLVKDARTLVAVPVDTSGPGPGGMVN